MPPCVLQQLAKNIYTFHMFTTTCFYYKFNMQATVSHRILDHQFWTTKYSNICAGDNYKNCQKGTNDTGLDIVEWQTDQSPAMQMYHTSSASDTKIFNYMIKST